MLKHVCIVVASLLFFAAGALAEEHCDAPWLTAAQARALPEAERTQEFTRLLVCAQQHVAEASARLANLSDVKIEEFANDLASERDRLNALLEARTGELNGARGEITALVTERNRLQGEVAELTSAAARKSAELEECEADNAALAGEIAALADERDRLRQELDEKTKALQDAQAALVGANARIVELEKERNDLAAKVESLTAALHVAEAKIKKLEEVRDRQAGVIDNQTAALNLANAKIAELSGLLAACEAEREEYAHQIIIITGNLEDTENELADAYDRIDALEDYIAELEAERDRLLEKVAKLKRERDDAVTERDAALGDNTRLSAENASLQKQLADANATIAALQVQLADEKANVAVLEAENAGLKQQVADLTKQLDEARAENARISAELNDAKVRIAFLEGQIDILAKQRSDFFAALMAALGNRTDVRIVGDRFVFLSSVMFAVGSAELNEEGRNRILAVAQAIKEIRGQIPNSIKWVLQVNGHTDVQQFRSKGKFANWELSTDRALSVVEVLIDADVDPRNLAAAGFGEWQPLVTGNTEDAYRQNRRIELKLTDDGPLLLPE